MSDGHNQHGPPKVSGFAGMYGLQGTDEGKKFVLREARRQLSPASLLRLRRAVGLPPNPRGRPPFIGRRERFA